MISFPHTHLLTMTGQVNLGTFQPDPGSRSGTVGLRLCGSLILLWVVCISPVTWSGDGARKEEAVLGNQVTRSEALAKGHTLITKEKGPGFRSGRASSGTTRLIPDPVGLTPGTKYSHSLLCSVFLH